LEKNRPLKYRRVLLKISGEAIEGSETPFDLDTVRRIASEIGELQARGAEIGIVIGGGNILRGAKLAAYGLDRGQSDYMGMLATIINGLLFENVLKSRGVWAVLQSALPIPTVAEEIFLKKTIEMMQKGAVVIFAGGTGSPYFTTDTAAALRAIEIGAHVLLKATKVDGVFDDDPELNRDALFLRSLRYDDLLSRQLKVMDMAAVSMCRDHALPILVFNIYQPGNIAKVLEGEQIGTIIKE
jgi:uridylate kinase